MPYNDSPALTLAVKRGLMDFLSLLKTGVAAAHDFLPADGLSPDYTGEFQVVLERSEEQRYGIVYTPIESYLVVLSIKESGACDGHNREMRRFPRESELYQQQITPGDEILMVSDASTPDTMKAKLMQDRTVHLRVRRPTIKRTELLSVTE
mmetsp:Transcript_24197/g.53678  ORF Transcript_24197/g.53678 Transcript_24197/m.53678 type:complete len:151 (-) Transcript_24197:122-574(-)